MGFDKQCIKIGANLLIEEQLKMLRPIFKEIIIVTNKPAYYQHLNCILTTDALKDFGPLGGIHAGLKAANCESCYFIACDMPNINPDYIMYMSDIMNRSNSYQAVVTRFGNWLEPFNAFYGKSLLTDIEHAYREHQIKISDLLAKVQTCYIEETVARSFSPDWSMFDNINTQEDLKVLEKKCSKIVKNNI